MSHLVPSTRSGRRRTSYQTSHAPGPIGAYSQACRIDMVVGGLVAVAGQVGVNVSTGILAHGTEAQTRHALRNMKELLTAAGLGLGDILRVDVHLATNAVWDEYETEYARWFPSNPPARTTVRSELRPGVLVEVTALAVG